MQDLDQTIVTPGKTIKFEKIELRPHLIILYPQTQFKQIPLPKGTITLGRGQDADVRLDDELVSRRHCAITFDGIRVTVKDLGSTNGTFVDGEFVEEKVLDSDNRLQIGKMVMKVEFKDKSEEAIDKALYEAATIDPLTKISNRRNFFDRSLGELALARRNNYFVHTIMVDADHFKRVNDTWGHQCGDMVLKEIARILNEEKREADLLARYGGEEFLLLLAGISPEDARKSAERLRKAVESHKFSWKDTVIPVTISLGLCSRQGENIGKIEELIAECDRLLYVAKEGGRNQVACEV
ncbi:GGDEF domain-containing protein [Fibrobacter sp.]|uniref:GGDEF domain-containing protein n=1 Tax=Fibrobacter sp. TaxID=35828 RepID=UPI0025C0A3DD|nr:GGDEF domain-containing protein [Fibrobacter sp.]MBR2307615.1 GGDEF domain-containing protein [Fibrobacter sp.]MBR4007291.1 GGDEF domain-containing protein [Fibrobacter sp.]